ncbi:hypothetical protein DFQ14_103117 [Halopolyspora algeriensis]|uniref:Excreted virulence factor EspC (Type VII ESX diderm) n=1 Tax=Halopolyspora algeriensis TaxID=1500506 RepID=A0A368VVD1_9ACTN|nr:hypothetical protein [Halopolyspora algeriensis]RCW45153.1 hypothetical protein DFQ14_103117 [Halopolyspora algeriensis]TQM53127.1 hypothetical protein FHU43_2507 [Halopolyspora algeriensis]
MSGGYRVSMDKLTQLVNDLDHAADDITAANRALSNARGRDLGTPGIDDASEEFRESWSHGISKISKGAKVTSDVLDAARATYARLENEASALIASAAEGQHPSSDGGGGRISEGQPSRIEQRLTGA